MQERRVTRFNSIATDEQTPIPRRDERPCQLKLSNFLQQIRDEQSTKVALKTEKYNFDFSQGNPLHQTTNTYMNANEESTYNCASEDSAHPFSSKLDPESAIQWTKIYDQNASSSLPVEKENKSVDNENKYPYKNLAFHYTFNQRENLTN